MDKNILKKFAIESRQDLMDKIRNKIRTFYIDEDFNSEQKGDIYILSNEKHSLNLTNEEFKKRELLIKRVRELSLEQVIEEAFIESYRMLCADNKDVLAEFITRVEKTLSEDSVRDKLMKYQKSADNLQSKRKSLLEKYLEGIVSQDIYEETDVGYERKLSDIKANIAMLEQQMEDEVSLKRRVADFKKALSQNEVLQEFDRGIFESIIEKVIVGGYDEEGNKDPYKITFIYKTGFKNEIGNAKERFDKSKSVGDKAKELCSHIVDEVKDVCSYVSDHTCGDGCSFVPTKTR